MAGMLDLGADELRSRLLDFDRAVAFRFPGTVFSLTIVGGGALVLLGYLSRPTGDLDVLDYPAVLAPYLEEYDLNGRVNAYQNNFAYNLADRLVALSLETKAVKCFSASLEDVVASKLHSERPSDVADVRNPEVLSALDWELLDRVASEMKDSALNERLYLVFQENYRAYREEFGPCAS